MIVTINSGSSSVKFALFPAEGELSRKTVLCEGQIDGIGGEACFSATDTAGHQIANERLRETATHEDALGLLFRWLNSHFTDHRLAAAGHRVPHGGTLYAAPVLLNSAILADLERLVPLAPLHQPHTLAAIKALAEIHPTLPQVASFDTAFHCTKPQVATMFAIPRALSAEGVRRYGFHGLSYEYIASVLPDYAGAAADGKVVVAHLGHGASMCAMRARQSVATTMAFTGLDGLPMGHRCGTIDPGVLLYLMDEKKMDVAAITELLYERSGLLGVSGISDDMRILLASHDPHAAEAVRLFVYRIGRELGSLAAALGGLDVLVFTAGIGEHAAAIREQVCNDAAWLGVTLDHDANAKGGPCITIRGSQVSAWVIPTDEDVMIARHTARLIHPDSQESTRAQKGDNYYEHRNKRSTCAEHPS
jgi:acetate kinase